jgi:CheY-like chemotaxis protein
MRTDESPAPSIEVLIADDDAPLRGAVRSLLEHQGYCCAEAGNGREALYLARQRLPQCILLDLAMPELDGFAVARALRADPATRAAHVHCLTGRTDPASRQDASAAGCEAFLTKPVDAAALLQGVGADVSRAGAEWLAGLTKAQAEDWLDWLEANGYPPAHLSYQEGQGFAVRCPGYRVSRDENGDIRFIKKLKAGTEPDMQNADTQAVTERGLRSSLLCGPETLFRTNPPSDDLNGLWDGVLSVLVVLAVVAVVIAACVVFPFVGLWRLVTGSRTKNRAA